MLGLTFLFESVLDGVKHSGVRNAQWGAVWLKIGGEKLEMYGSRVSFVFRSQGVVVDRAYTALSNRDGEDE